MIERLNRFYTDFAEKVTSQIDWHVKELLLKVLKENGIGRRTTVGYCPEFCRSI